MYLNDIKRNPYAAISESMYLELTGLRVDKPFIHLSNVAPRSKTDPKSSTKVLQAYPNPIQTGMLTVDLYQDGTLDLIGISGKQYFTEYSEKGSESISIEDINESIILLKFTDDFGEVSFDKVIKI